GSGRPPRRAGGCEFHGLRVAGRVGGPGRRTLALRVLRRDPDLGRPACRCVLRRPIAPPSGGADPHGALDGHVRRLQRLGRAVDIAISTDLDARPDLLQDRRLLVSVGHDEYWSWGMRDRLDAFTAAGGNAAIFGGNTCCWQVRFDDERRTMTSFKYRADEDPV